MASRDVDMYTEVQMNKFHIYRACSALAAVAALVVASGAGSKFG